MNEHRMSCKDARRAYRDAGLPLPYGDERKFSQDVERHLQGCDSCREDYRLHRLSLGVLKLGGAIHPIVPNDEWFAGVRARINRQALTDRNAPEETWQSILWLNARQLIPIMALLVLIVLGATMLWSTSARPNRSLDRGSIRPSDRVFFNEVYEYPQPTSDDVLQMLVAVEERPNGK